MNTIQLISLVIFTTCVVIFLAGALGYFIISIIAMYTSGEILGACILSLIFIGGMSAAVLISSFGSPYKDVDNIMKEIRESQVKK